MNNLRNIRRKQNISIKQLHEMTGFPIRTLEDWDAEKRQIQSYHRVKLLARVLKCDMDSLMTKEEKCLFGGKKAVISLVQEEDGVHIYIFDSEFLEELHTTTMDREKALKLLKDLKKNPEIKDLL